MFHHVIKFTLRLINIKKAKTEKFTAFRNRNFHNYNKQ